MLDNKGFDLWADGYDEAVGLSEESNVYPFAGYKNVLGYIYEVIMEKPGAAVLDIGFGTATLTSKLYENGCEVYGQDFSARMIDLAQKKMPDAKLYQGDITKGIVPELHEKKFDFIVGTYSIHHLNDEQKVEFIKELLGLLNDGGKILFGDVAFDTREKLEQCKVEEGQRWDDDEIYFVVDELKVHFPDIKYEPKSYCSGVVVIEKVSES